MRETHLPRLFATATLVALPGVAAGAAVMPYVADADTVALYHLDEATGALGPNGYINDASTNNLDLRGPYSQDSPFEGVAGPSGLGTAATYDGDTDRTFVFPAPLSSAIDFKQWTAEAWIRNPGTGNNTISYIQDDGQAQRLFFRLNTSGTGSIVQLIFNNAVTGSTTLNSSPRTLLADDTWYHVAVTYDDQGSATANDSLIEFFLTPESSSTAVSLGTITGVNDVKALNGMSEILEIGQGAGANEIGGNLDEFRLSSTVRTEFNLVPEPASLVLAGLALPCLLRRRR